MPAGGETVFPAAGLSVAPRKGNAVYFEYANARRQVDPASLHAGARVIEGEKNPARMPLFESASEVELALDLSYQHLSGDRQRLLRLVALHPGQDFDGYAAGAEARYLADMQGAFEVQGDATAVPEPATWALMIIGFGGAGAMLRSRRRRALAV